MLFEISIGSICSFPLMSKNHDNSQSELFNQHLLSWGMYICLILADEICYTAAEKIQEFVQLIYNNIHKDMLLQEYIKTPIADLQRWCWGGGGANRSLPYCAAGRSQARVRNMIRKYIWLANATALEEPISARLEIHD